MIPIIVYSAPTTVIKQSLLLEWENALKSVDILVKPLYYTYIDIAKIMILGLSTGATPPD